MLNKRLTHLLLAAVTAITVVTAVTAVSVTASGALSTPARPGLNAPNLRVRAAAAAAPTAADPCGYHASIPADSFKGIPVFDAAQAAEPFDVRFVTTQGTVTVRMLTDQAPCTTFSFRLFSYPGLLQEDPLPSAYHSRDLRTAVR
jgi:peptidyl-prolyl cis-trans isomerase B (cyclophilin B)